MSWTAAGSESLRRILILTHAVDGIHNALRAFESGVASPALPPQSMTRLGKIPLVGAVGGSRVKLPMKTLAPKVRNSGLTLIELLAMIAVIAILAAMVLPALSGRSRQPTLIPPKIENLGTNAVPVLIDFLTTNKFHPQQNATNQLHISYRNGRVLQSVMQTLGNMGTNGDAAVPVLITYLKDSDTMSQRVAAETLGVIGRNRMEIVIPALMNALTNSTGNARACATDALAKFGNDARSAVAALLSASQGQDAYLQIRAATAVKIIAPETPDALAPLIKGLSSIEPGVRQQTIYALGSLGTNAAEAIPALLKCLSHRDFTTRYDTTLALRGMGLDSDEYIAKLSQNLSDTNDFVSRESVFTLMSLAKHSELAFVELIKAMNNSRTEVGQQAKFGLIDAARNDPKFLLNCLGNSDPLIRYRALVVFYDLERGFPDSISTLRQLSTNDPDTNVRGLASDVLRLQLQ